MSDRPRVFVGGPPEFIRAARAALGAADAETVGEATFPQDLYMLVDRVQPDGVLVDSAPEWVSAAVDLARVRPNLRVFVAGSVSAETWARLSRAGALTLSADPARAARDAAAALKRLVPTRFRFEEGPLGEPGEARIPGRVEVARPCLAAVYSNKGGAGKTTVAANLAAWLGLWSRAHAREHGAGYRVAFIDFNADWSTGKYAWTGVAQSAAPKTVALWADLSEQASWADVEAVMNYHEAANVHFAAGPASPAERKLLDAGTAGRIMALARRYFHFAVVDLGTAVEGREAAEAALVSATDALLIAEFDPDAVASLADACAGEVMSLIGDPAKVSFVLNKVHDAWFSARDLLAVFREKAGFPMVLKAELPFDPAVERHKARGAPLVCLDRSAPFAKGIGRLARALVGAAVDLDGGGERKRRGLLSLFRRGK